MKNKLVNKIKAVLFYPRGEPRLELGVHVFRIMWNYFGICPFIYCLLLGNESGSGSRCTRY